MPVAPELALDVAGFGTVAGGLAEIIARNAEWIERRIGRRLTLGRILVRDLSRPRPGVTDPRTVITDDIDRFFAHSPSPFVVELIGGTTVARQVVLRALEAGKHVVTANKALLAEHGDEIFALASARGLSVCFEAAVAGGVPVVQALKEGLAGNRIKKLTGILNGTANLILTEMTDTGRSFADALASAQENGFAEADPALDVQGIDAAHKLILLIRLAYGQSYPLADLPVEGIAAVDPYDITVAREFGYRIKLLAHVADASGLLQAGVFPMLVRDDHMLAKVDGAYNAVLLRGNAVGPIMLYGQGAGALPTGSAVLSDIMGLVIHGRQNNSGFADEKLTPARILDPDLAVNRHYFRLMVQDKPGVLGALATLLGEYNISIAQAVQRRVPGHKGVPVVFLTHSAPARDIRSAVTEIASLPFVLEPPVRYRIL